MTAAEKTAEQSHMFACRLRKKQRRLRKWAARNNVECYRLYDKDIPEIPLAVDRYRLLPDGSAEPLDCALAYLYERPYPKDESDEAQWLSAMLGAASGELDIPVPRIYAKVRRRQRGNRQYEKAPEAESVCGVLLEHGLRFRANLGRYLDTGIFLDHRPLRKLLAETACGKTVLNLFCYTGAFSVYAASGGAASVDSVDMSNAYLETARQNMRLNGLGENAAFHRADVLRFVQAAREAHKTWDIIVVDPPTFSNSKKMRGTLDLNADWAFLVGDCVALLNEGGTLYFSTNSKRLKFDADTLREQTAVAARGKVSTLDITEITASTIPEDFVGTKPHRVWSVALAGNVRVS
ncbi:class I SAM-dependent methyltransferase [Treponema endosymbiont of Eucomonympha sp.]|uniref:class I SAM-dependent methyltransferase n=1 Tax=Treponema endosymbiont of Eucomonympha sp. TaxID=1580831 RepID=UPI000786629D|nr:class I SAM-dependent methyltransferase [Treponema endosymbiont of Eucomonympha sp.]